MPAAIRAFSVGRAGGFQAQGADAVDHAAARVIETLADLGVLHHGKTGLQTGHVVGLARRHQRDGALGNLGLRLAVGM
jgi:hypothetical protein